MAFTVSAIAAKDSAGSAITGGLLAGDIAGSGSGPWFLYHGLVDGVLGVNKAKVVAATTAAATGDTALVVALHPSSTTKGAGAADATTTRVTIDSGQLGSIGPGLMAAAVLATFATDQTKIPVHGNTAHDGVDADKPIKIGGYASAAAPTNVSADADVVNAWHLRNGAYAVNLTAAGALIPGDATTGLFVGGAVAHDGVDTGNPQKIGGKATNVEPAAVSATGDRTNLITDMVGKLIVLPYANPENFVSGAITSAMTGTTSTSLIAAPASGLRNYITQITVSNAHATVGTDIAIQDGNGGATLYTIPAAAVYGGAVVTFPTPLRQTSTATAIFCANVTTGASTKVSASGYKGV